MLQYEVVKMSNVTRLGVLLSANGTRNTLDFTSSCKPNKADSSMHVSRHLLGIAFSFSAYLSVLEVPIQVPGQDRHDYLMFHGGSALTLCQRKSLLRSLVLQVHL